jgi:hypothetical protein
MFKATPAETIVPELLTLQQAAELCGVSPRTLWTWATMGAGPAPPRIHKGTARYGRPAYLEWISGGCKPLNALTPGPSPNGRGETKICPSPNGRGERRMPMRTNSKTSWKRVTRRRPCPICRRLDWCMYAGGPHRPTAICARTESRQRAGEGGGFPCGLRQRAKNHF